MMVGTEAKECVVHYKKEAASRERNRLNLVSDYTNGVSCPGFLLMVEEKEWKTKGLGMARFGAEEDAGEEKWYEGEDGMPRGLWYFKDVPLKLHTPQESLEWMIKHPSCPPVGECIGGLYRGFMYREAWQEEYELEQEQREKELEASPG